MGLQTKTIGRQPTDHGIYDPNVAYGKKFIVTLYDCGWESKHDNNTTAPATLNTQTGTITPNTTDWIKRWGSYEQWLIDNGYKKMDASHVKDNTLNKPQNEINASIVGEIGADSASGTIKGRIKSLENSVGTGGSVDQRIDAAENKIIGGASSSGNTLKKVEDRTATLESAVGNGGSVDTRIFNAVAVETTRAQAAEADRYTKAEVNGLVDTPHQEYVTVATYASLPALGSKDTIYRVSNYDGSQSQVDNTVYSEYAWDGTQYVFLCVKSQIGEVFDISAYNNNAKYADLAAALNGGANIPQSLQKGGMSVKFVQSSDNKYVQYRLMSDEWSTNTDNWSFCGDDILIDNPEFIEVKTDNENKILECITNNGTKQINIPVDTPSAIIEHSNNPEFLQVVTDNKSKKLWWIDKDGNVDWSLGVPKPIKDYFGKYDSYVEGDFTPDMSRSELVNIYNSKLVEFCELCKCNIDCMDRLDINDSDEVLYEKINHNFREDVLIDGMSSSRIASQLNKYFQIPIYRFSDIKLNTSNNIDNSLIIPPFASYAFEPSALISDDGERIELYNESRSRSTSIDGVHWTEAVSLVLNGRPNWATHCSVNKVDEMYMLIGCRGGGDDDRLTLYTSSDGINFTIRGTIFEANKTIVAKINGVDTVCTGWGNPYLFKDNGTYYLFYECLIRGWEICLATCTDLFEDQGDGFIGNWTQCDINPIIPRININGDPTNHLKPGNPEFAKGTDNRPLKYNGNYYMYYHAQTGNDKAPILRAYSKDLVHWTSEGIIFDNRDLPTLPRGTNSDQALCEFKGRTYLFYTHDINNYEGPNHTADLSAISIRVTCDDRPYLELLKIRA